LESFFYVAQIIVAVLLVVVILLQVRGQGSGFFGNAEASFRTRRGVERTLFQFTIVLGIAFTLLAIGSAIDLSSIF
jgi:preprotein translocase subunit SecG